MATTSRLVLRSLSILLLLLPLGMARLGLPLTLKADEPAYYLAALSLVRDGDAVCGPEDLRRLVDAYPHLPVENLILMSLDGWRTVSFGKPLTYSLLAAPFAAALGSRGLVAFNMLLFVAMIWIGFRHLRRSNPESLAAFFAASFFLVSVAFVYVFWLHPEVLNMFSVMVCLSCAFTAQGSSRLAPPSRAPLFLRRLSSGLWPALWSGGALAIAVYNKPMFAALGLPALFLFWRRHGVRSVLVWVLAAALGLFAQAGISYQLTDTSTPYLGTSRIGFKIDNPDDFDQLLAPFDRPLAAAQNNSSYGWLARIPRLFPRMLIENIGYFFIGRHTGLFVYLPFTAVCLALFLLHQRRDPARWLVLGAIAAVAVFFLVWIHYNWHGGAGFIGNRYLVSLYPAFLFLVARARPTGLAATGYVAGGLFVAPILLTPFGAPVPDPTLQSHVRGAPFQMLPQELTLAHNVPGYINFNTRGLTIRGRRDQFRIADHAAAAFRIRGADRTELWISSAEPLEEIQFSISSPAAENEVVVALGGEHHAVHFRAAEERHERILTLRPRRATKTRYQYDKKLYAYRLTLRTTTGRNPRRPDGEVAQPQFYVGAEIAIGRVIRHGPAASEVQ